jgi:hypothetical protein
MIIYGAELITFNNNDNNNNNSKNEIGKLSTRMTSKMKSTKERERESFIN